ncbi:conserved hypothetical protein; putative exported protein [Herminiimonas arsenicoxydans]|uniref:Secreted protein n=1 Tax=Herminiimonas arsenicoxydans TaxID=204773 RepID=A4G5F5_HERAR|nr:conserved hypothetical protein; putative exported protein [Herminiimonas arsenicoxydans]
MFFSLKLMVAGLVLLPLAVLAQAVLQQPDPADADAAVPAPGYTSALNNYRPAKDQAATPDKLWRAANDEVQNPAGHAGHTMETESSDAAPAPKTDAHAGHGHDSHQNKGK